MVPSLHFLEPPAKRERERKIEVCVCVLSLKWKGRECGYFLFLGWQPNDRMKGLTRVKLPLG
jgi:hypothetical protein